MEKEGVVEARKNLWNVIHGGEEYMRKFSEEEKSGWLHIGRSSPSLRVVASRVAFRELQLKIMASSLDLRERMIDVSAQHLETLMPGYSYIQHIEPGTFGFYLMSFVEPLSATFNASCSISPTPTSARSARVPRMASSFRSTWSASMRCSASIRRRGMRAIRSATTITCSKRTWRWRSCTARSAGSRWIS